MRLKAYIGLLLVCVFYWTLDSIWSFLSFEINLEKLIFSEPSSYLDTFLLRVSPYQIVSRLMVIALFAIFGSVIIEIFIKRRAVEKERQVAVEKYRSIFDNAAEGIFQTGPDGRLLIANPAMAGILGYNSPEELIKSITNLAQDLCVVPDKSFELINKLEKFNQVRGFEFQAYKKDKSIIHVSANAHIIRDDRGDVSYISGILEDITEKKKVNELIVGMEAAEAATQAKSEFLSNMSHEIRTPMNAIVGLIRLALKTDLTDNQLDYLKKIDISAQALLGIINDILDFSKIEAGRLDMESTPFHLKDVLFRLTSLSEIKIREKGLKFLIDLDPEVPGALVGDPLRLGQVLINLTNNAVKFTQMGSIVIRIKRLEDPEPGQVKLHFEVSDTGVGISRAQLSKLFKPFSQGDSSITRQYGGTGLGLTISKRLVEMMEGDIWVESEWGQGTTFFFTGIFGSALTPEQKDDLLVSERKREQTLEDINKIRWSRILVVEDNEINQQVARELLSGEQFSVDLASNGLEALKKISQKGNESLYDAVLMDIQMPIMDGYAAAAEIRKWEAEQSPEKAKNLPIIALTSHATKGERAKCLAAGMDDYLTKPVDPDHLFATLVKWIEPGQRTIEMPGIRPIEPSPQLPADLPGIDIEEGLKIIGGRRDMYFKLLIKFYDYHSGAINDMNNALHKSHLEEAYRLAHTLKGVAGNIGAVELYQSTAALEAALHQSDIGLASSLLQETAIQLNTVLESIRPLAEFKENNSPDGGNQAVGANHTKIEVSSHLSELAESIELDVSEARKKLEELISMIGVLPETDAIEEALDNYDSDEAVKIINELANRLELPVIQ